MRYLQAHYDRIEIQKNNAEQFFNLLKKLGIIKEGMKILDIGSGRGFFIQLCRQNNIDCYGCDIDDDAFYDEKVLRMNICYDYQPYKDGFFDAVTMHEVLDRLVDAAFAMSEISKIIKKEGKIIIVSDSILMYDKLLRFYGDSTHVRPYTKDALKEILRMHSFKTILCEPKLAGKTFLWKLPSFIKWRFGNSILIIGEKV